MLVATPEFTVCVTLGVTVPPEPAATVSWYWVPVDSVKFAWTVASPDVSVTVVLALVALPKVTPALVVVQFTNAYPLAGEAEIAVAVPEFTVCAPPGVAVPFPPLCTVNWKVVPLDPASVVSEAAAESELLPAELVALTA
jgi:hypothetical protein